MANRLRRWTSNSDQTVLGSNPAVAAALCNSSNSNSNIFIQDCRKVKKYLSKATFLQKERERDRIKGVWFFVRTCPGYWSFKCFLNSDLNFERVFIECKLAGRSFQRIILGQGSLLPLFQGEAYTLASISYPAILVKYILAKKKKVKTERRSVLKRLNRFWKCVKAQFDKNAYDKRVARRSEHPSLAPKFCVLRNASSLNAKPVV